MEFEFDKERIDKLKHLLAEGIDPYGSRFDKTAETLKIKSDFDKLEGKDEKIAGRIIAKRDHGTIKFIDIQDETGTIQIYFSNKHVNKESIKIAELLDVGDIIGVYGSVVKTKTDEISIDAKEVVILSKSLLPLPPRWYGLEDTEKRFRKRYLDLIINRESMEKIKKGSIMVSKIREILGKKGYTEVVVPILQPIPGGANAKPFITHYNSLDRDFYLKIASELYLKRLLVGGFEKVFDISKNFRNEGIDTRHNPEFMMLEAYQAYGDLSSMLELTEEIIKEAIYAANGTYSIKFGEKNIDFSKFEIKTMEEMVKEKTGVNNDQEIIKRGKVLDSKVESYGEAINAIFEAEISDNIINPVFVTKFPIEVSPLAKNMEDDPRFVYRFELYIAGMEIANAFSELNNPIEQIKRFEEEARRKNKGIDETQEFDKDVIEALGYGMPPTGGVGIGIDRIQMLGTNSKSIKEVIPFPQLRTFED
ncbi:MAG: tRNA synthetase class II (D K and N) [Candidatus Parvarchaeum acidophilus ARMAN-5]|uniref:Lysine--tRNA ligase n=1 Tax=Candidatus Parvarchaeum acidophilus ARMAN-5 TaxID=662762 RepID=D6GV50_PARA5|nr:MAG: tRNA synthetase class II (D K and N) [Candidatus Parvarchaeum acidophilus ARMAN-5]